MMVNSTKAPTPRNTEKICTITIFVGVMPRTSLAPSHCVVCRTAITLITAQIRHKTSRKISARLKKSFTYFFA